MDIITIIAQPVATILVGSAAYIVYRQQRSDQKRDAAGVILQEIHRAEKIINKYKATKDLNYGEEVIANNSWTGNLQHFVQDLTEDERDKISDLYSLGERIDVAVSKCFDTFYASDAFEVNGANHLRINGQPEDIQMTALLVPNPGANVLKRNDSNAYSLELLKSFFELIVDTKYEPIFDSHIGTKLKRIAHRKWYRRSSQI